VPEQDVVLKLYNVEWPSFPFGDGTPLFKKKVAELPPYRPKGIVISLSITYPL
jgi:hypothetical protein